MIFRVSLFAVIANVSIVPHLEVLHFFCSCDPTATAPQSSPCPRAQPGLSTRRQPKHTQVG